MSASKIIQIALGEVGYLEKKSNSQLNDKTANAGSNNYTKYGAWYGVNGQPWCDMFVSWCAAQANEASAVGKFAYCPYHVSYFKSKGQWHSPSGFTPRAGDIIFFGDADHVGLVKYSDGTYVYTVEGNTSGASGLIANGGGVCEKYYPLNSSYIMGYGRPAYTDESGSSTPTPTVDPGKSRLNGIDISGWQAGINIAAMTTTDFVIVKATQGTTYTSDYFVQQIEAAIKAGKKVGAYHYATGVGAKAEAEYFLQVVKPYIGKAVLALDWETSESASGKNIAFNNIGYAKEWLDYVKAQTGITPVIYTSESVAAGKDWSSVAKDYKLWGAQYPNYTETDYKTEPWSSGGWGAWSWPTIFQYSSSGKVTGYNSRLDINLFYGSAADWDVMAGASQKYTIGWHKNTEGWWYSADGYTYYHNTWAEIDDEWYYFDSEGYCLINTEVEYDGKIYTFDENGHCTVREKEDEPEKKEEIEVRYYKLSEIQKDYYRPTIDKLIEKGLLKGKGGTGEDMIVDLSEDSVRILVMLDRAGAFD